MLRVFHQPGGLSQKIIKPSSIIDIHMAAPKMVRILNLI
jgi:hypothetical protein